MKKIKCFSLAITMLFSFVALAQEKTVSGIVTDSTKQFLPGVNVVVKGTLRGTQTDIEGKYTIKAKQGEVLVFGFVGMEEQLVTVGSASTINITLMDNNIHLQPIELPYTPMPRRKNPVIGTIIKAEDIEKPKTDILQQEKENHLYILDGNVITYEAFKELNPENILSITLLKKNAQTQIVQCNGQKDVFVIRSKRLSKKELRKQKREAGNKSAISN